MKAAVIIVWFGPFPPWVSAFLVSCQRVKCIDWHIFHDHPFEFPQPENVVLHPYSLGEFQSCVTERLGVNGKIVEPYKVCDFRPAFGVLFEEYITGYSYFGWGDLDVVFGNVDKFLQGLLGRWDVISFTDDFPSNHFILLKNTEYFRRLYLQIEDYRSLLESPQHHAADDFALFPILRAEPKAWFKELFATPHICWKPWMDGTYNFPTRWFWNNGQLTNDLDVGFEFLYFHFMVWKGGYRDYYCRTQNWEGVAASKLKVDLDCGAFSLSVDGLRTRSVHKAKKLLRAGLDGKPDYDLRRRFWIKASKWFR